MAICVRRGASVLVCFVVIFYSGVIQCFAAIVNHLNSIFADYSGDWFIPFVGDDVWLSVVI